MNIYEEIIIDLLTDEGMEYGNAVSCMKKLIKQKLEEESCFDFDIEKTYKRIKKSLLNNKEFDDEHKNIL